MPAVESPVVESKTAELDPLYKVLKPCHWRGFTPPPLPKKPKLGEKPEPPHPPTLVRRSQFGPKLDFSRANSQGEWPYGKDMTEAMQKQTMHRETDATILRLLSLGCIAKYEG